MLGASDRAGVDSDKDFSEVGWRLESEEGALPEELKPGLTAEDLKLFTDPAVEVGTGWTLESEEGALPEELKPVLTADDEGSKLFPDSDNVELWVDWTVWTVVASLACVSLGIPLVPFGTGELELGTTVKVVEPCGDPVGFELERRDDDTGAFEPGVKSEGVEVSERSVGVEAEEASWATAELELDAEDWDGVSKLDFVAGVGGGVAVEVRA